MPAQWTVAGEVHLVPGRHAASGLLVHVVDLDGVCSKPLGSAVTDSEGRYEVRYDEAAFRHERETPPDICVQVRDADGRLLTDSVRAATRHAGARQVVDLGVRDLVRSVICIAGLDVDLEHFERLEPEGFLELARSLLGCPCDPDRLSGLWSLCPDLSADLLHSGSLTRAVRLLQRLPQLKEWSEAVAEGLRGLLAGRPGPDATLLCGPFRIEYATSGTDAPPAEDTGRAILLPGTPTVVGTTVARNGVPDYIERLCFWLRRALAAYTDPPFSLRDPAQGLGTIRVVVKSIAMFNAYTDEDLTLHFGNGMNDAMLAFRAAHELMHVVQGYGYGGEDYEMDGEWAPALREGGAVLAEDAVFDRVNRYAVIASTPGGPIATPYVRMNIGQGYGACLLLKYICEQQSGRVGPSDEPMIGVETYRSLLEQCHARGYGTGTVADVVEGLPYFQSFYAFKYVDAAKLDESASETLLGNFWLALYLKDLGTANPDRRFGFMENNERVRFEELESPSDVTTVASLGKVAVADRSFDGAPLVLASGQSEIQPFAAAFYRVSIAPAVDTCRVVFNSYGAFDRPLVQIVLVEGNSRVRDILRSDRTEWRRTIASVRNGIALDHMLIVVAGTDVGGPFGLKVEPASPAPDVMVSRWHHAAGTHYEIDSRGWAWTWVSPDIWVDNDDDGLADDLVLLGEDNRLRIRMRNQGRAAAHGISVRFWYQEASAGLSDAAWQPVCDAHGVVQVLTGLALAAGATGTFSVNWAPRHRGESAHFCVRAVLSVPGDPNVDNKRCLSNFANVRARERVFRVTLACHEPPRIPIPPETGFHSIPRAFHRWAVNAGDLARARSGSPSARRLVRFGFRIERQPITRLVLPVPAKTPSRVERIPDPLGHYPTDARALPPGLDDVPMMTLIQRRGAEVVGGFTWAIRED